MVIINNRHVGGTIAMGSVFGSLTLMALTGNILVITAIYSTKRLRKLENLYFASMAVADLLLSLLVMTFAAVNDILGHWPFGVSYCKIWMSLDIMCCTASILNLCAISFDRYYHINDPMRYSEKMTCKKVWTAVIMVWCSSVLIAFVPLSFKSHFHSALSTQRFNVSVGHELSVDICNFDLDPFYAVISSTISFYLPCAVMTTAYTKLYRYAHKHVLSIKKQFDSTNDIVIKVIPDQNSVNIHPNPNPNPNLKEQNTNHNSNDNKVRKEVSEQKARVTLGIIMGVFLICWTPFFVANVIKSVCHCIPDWLFTVLTWLGYTNSTLNPLIYSIFNRDFRYAFKRILLCQKRHQYYCSKDFVISNGGPSGRRFSDLSYVSNVTNNML